MKLRIYTLLNGMKTQNNRIHFYELPSGQIVKTQLEGRMILGIGRNAFRNRVKSGVIKKILSLKQNTPQGYYGRDTVNS